MKIFKKQKAVLALPTYLKNKKLGWGRGSEGSQAGRVSKGESQLKSPVRSTLGKGLSEGNEWAKFPVLTTQPSIGPSSGFWKVYEAFLFAAIPATS